MSSNIRIIKGYTILYNNMDLTIRRQKCKRSFDRNGLESFNGAPVEEVRAVIDKVEIAADNFKYLRCFKRAMLIFTVLLLICVVGCGVKAVQRHKREQRMTRMNTQPHLGGANPGFFPHHMKPDPKNIPTEVRPEGPTPPEEPQGPNADPAKRRHHGHRGHHGQIRKYINKFFKSF